MVTDLGQPALTWSVMHQHAGLTLLRGDLATAEAEIVAAHEHAMATGQPDAPIFFLAQDFLLRLDQGRLPELEETIRVFVERTGHPTVKARYGLLLTEAGRWHEAGEVFDELAATNFAAPPNNVLWLLCAAECASLCARLGRAASAPTLRSMLEPYADQLVVIAQGGAVSGSVAYYLGLLAATARDWNDAAAHFAAAAALYERIGAPVFLARTELEWGRMLQSRNAPGDDKQADELLGRALATARRLGLAGIEREATTLLR